MRLILLILLNSFVLYSLNLTIETDKNIKNYTLKINNNIIKKNRTYNIDINQTILTKSILINLTNMKDYCPFGTIIYEPLFNGEKTIFSFQSTLIKESTSSAKNVKYLLKSKIKNRDKKDLLKRYSNLKYIVEDRIKRHKYNIHHLDIQIVYQYLEVIRELGEKFYIYPPLGNTFSWFKTAYNSNAYSKQFKFALEETYEIKTKQMIKQITMRKHTKLKELWNLIRNSKRPKPIKYEQYIEYKKLLNNFEDRTKKEILNQLQISYFQVLEGISLNLRPSINYVNSPIEKLDQLIKEINDITNPKHLKAKEEHLLYLRATKKKLIKTQEKFK